MIFQNGFGSSKEVVSPREPEQKPFLEKPEPCQRGPKGKNEHTSKTEGTTIKTAILNVAEQVARVRSLVVFL